MAVKYLMNPEDTEKEAVAYLRGRDTLRVPRSVILTFSQEIIDELEISCGLHEWKWSGAYLSPFTRPLQCGISRRGDLAVIIPQMGASPVAALCEELVQYGAKAILLLCGTWSLGKGHLGKGEIQLPSFAIGLDGTTPHYGNRKQKVEAESKMYKSIKDALTLMKANWKSGGVGICEAFYRITPAMAEQYRKDGCLSIENGEVASLFSLAATRKIQVGALLQPYIDLERGWALSYIDDVFKETCRVQARAATMALKMLEGF